jgi:hypothetical protein
MREKKSIYDLKEEYIATAIENDEPNNEEMQKGDKLENLQYADGKERDEIDQIEAEEKLRGADKISPFETNDTRVFKRKLKTMSAVQKANLATKTATRIFADTEQQDQALMKAFHEWRGTNWGSTGGHTEQKVKVLAAESKEDFQKNIKSKTLSELQEMMMKLGFTPSFDRNRIISVLTQEYLKRG